MTFRSIVLAAAMVGIASSASALTITFSDGTNTARVTDQEFVPTAPNTDPDLNATENFILFGNVTVGNFIINGDVFGGFSPIFGADVLVQGVFAINNVGNGGTETLTMVISQDDYSFGAGAAGSSAYFGLGHAGLTEGDSLESSSWMNDSNTLLATEDLVGTALALNGNGAFSDSTSTSDTSNLTAPFSMTTQVAFTTSGGGAANFTTILAVKPVPLPAGFALLLTALGGFGFMARRRASA